MITEKRAPDHQIGRVEEVNSVVIEVWMIFCDGTRRPVHVHTYHDDPVVKNSRLSGMSQWTMACAQAEFQSQDGPVHINKVTYCELPDDPHYHRNLVAHFQCEHNKAPSPKDMPQKARKRTTKKVTPRPLP